MARVLSLLAIASLVVAGIAAVFLVRVIRATPKELPYVETGQPAPGLTLSPLGDGPGFDDETLRKPGMKLVNFWASWCVPCRAEHPNITKLAQEGVPVYGVNYKDQPEQALAFLNELGDPFAGIAADAEGLTANDWGVYGLPASFVIDGEGTVVLRYTGPITASVLQSTIRPALESLN